MELRYYQHLVWWPALVEKGRIRLQYYLDIYCAAMPPGHIPRILDRLQAVSLHLPLIPTAVCCIFSNRPQEKASARIEVLHSPSGIC